MTGRYVRAEIGETDAEASVPRFGVLEISCEHGGDHSNPYRDVEVHAEFTGPRGGRRRIPGFWDGGRTWRFRFSPDEVGSWGYEISSSDPDLNGRRGNFACVPSDLMGGLQPMDGYPHHFQRQDGTPVWFLGETAWRGFMEIPQKNYFRRGFDRHVDIRARQEFNYIHCQLLGHALLDGSPPRNRGGSPWVDDRVGVRVNPGYFEEVDDRIRYINDRGITCGIVLAWHSDWTRFPDQGERLRFARYVAARYSAFDVAFIISGEYHGALQPPPERAAKDPEAVARYGGLDVSVFREIGTEIMNNDPHNRLRGIHPLYTHGGSSREFIGEPWMTLGDYQEWYGLNRHGTPALPEHRRSLHDAILQSRGHNKPVINAEFAYFLRDQDGDGRVDKPHSRTIDEIRRASWSIAMAGGYFVTGFGSTYLGGERHPGPFDVDYPQNRPWEEQVQNIKRFFESMEWWKLEPADDSVECRADAVYCLAEPGRQYAVYVEGASEPVTLNLKGGNPSIYSFRMFDPRTGEWRELQEIEGQSSVELVPADESDWAFLLKSRS
ncbi:MAG: apiosidase-like domain-containing protein [bacterium]